MNTLQQIYDAGLAHIRAQGKPSILDGVCKYRMTDSTGAKLKCIIGGLIPDELYDPHWDANGSTSATNLPEDVLKALFGPITPFDMLRSMQFAHDKATVALHTSFMEGFESRMRLVAEKYGLVYS